MGGNTFLNFFLLAMVEGPATYLGLVFAVSKSDFMQFVVAL
jgi:hypothetical protein